MSAFGLALLAFVGVTLVLTGLPAYAVLILAAVIGAVVGVASGHIPFDLLGALPGRLINLFENDLLQALPLYVLMGVLLNRMGIAPALFRTLVWILPRRPGAPLVAGVGLGALLGPMSGSVGASALALSRTAEPQLAASGVPADVRQATIALASTMGVVIPPSLVLILLGDAMLTAHTIARNATGSSDRIINTQDVLRGALLPAGILLCLCIAVAWVAGNRYKSAGAGASRMPQPALSEIMVAVATLAFLVLTLGGVATGYFYAVEAAATGAFVLFVAGLLTGRLTHRTLPPMLSEIMATTGALFAPLLAATTFTLLLRLLGTDKLIEGWVTGLPGGALVVTAAVLGAIFLSAFVLDAFEIIFVAVPILIPPLLMRVPDAVWVSSLVLLTLQASFLLPPVGYALIISRGMLTETAPGLRVARALLPFMAAQLLVLASVLAVPRLVHMLSPDEQTAARAPAALPGRNVVDDILRQIPPLPAPGVGPQFPGVEPPAPGK
jgi:tripartite ATP-independent transporter DctM subunit